MRLGLVLKKYRLMMEYDLRAVAKEIGIGASTLMRIEHGHEIDAKTFLKIINWLMERGGFI